MFFFLKKLGLIFGQKTNFWLYQKFYWPPRHALVTGRGQLFKRLLAGVDLSEYVFIRVNTYLYLSGDVCYDGDRWWRENFLNLYDMISDGKVYRVKKEPDFGGQPYFVLRTRNNLNKGGVMYNTDVEFLKPIMLGLLNLGFRVVNIGSPCRSIDIEHPFYDEYSHFMPIDKEFELCANAVGVILTAKAGLFTAFAATDLTLIQYDDEWSDSYGVKLFDARSNAGILDLDIRGSIKSNVSSAVNQMAELYRLKCNVSERNNGLLQPMGEQVLYSI